MDNETTKLEEVLSIHFQTEEVDLLDIGILGYDLHRVVNQVAITICESTDRERQRNGSGRLLRFIPQSYSREDNLIRAKVQALRQGSIEMDICGLVASAVFSEPGAVSILQNLFSNVIWVIAKYAIHVPGVAVQWIRRNESRDAFIEAVLKPTGAHKKIRPRIIKFVEMLAQSENGGKLRLKTQDAELEIEFFQGPRAEPSPQLEPDADIVTGLDDDDIPF